MVFRISKEYKLKKIELILENSEDEDIEILMDYMKDSELEVREEAAKAIVKKGSNVAIDSLLKAMSSDDPTYRNKALEALVLMGEKVVPHLLSEIDNEDKDVRKFVIDTLGEIGDEKSLKFIIEKIDDEDENVAQSACENLGKFAKVEAVDALIAALDKSEWIQFAAIEALGNIGDPKSVPHILKVMKEANEWIKHVALEALTKIKDETVIGELLPEIYSKNEELVKGVIVAINTILKDSFILKEFPKCVMKKYPDFKEKILEYYEKVSERDVRIAIINLISIFSFKDFTNYLAKDLISSDDDIAEAAMETLISMGEDIYPDLLKILGKESTGVELKIAVIYMLGEIFYGKKSYFYILEEYFESKYPEIREIALEAMAKIDSNEVKKNIDIALTDRNPDVRRMALEIVGVYSKESDFDKILKLLSDKYDAVRYEAKQTILKLKKDDIKDKIILELKKELKNPNIEKVKLLMEIVGEHNIKESVGYIIKIIEDNIELKESGIVTLGNLKSRVAFDYLLERLRDKEVSVRKVAADSLGKIGLIEVVEALKESVSDSDMWVRFFVINALNNYKKDDLYKLYIDRLEIEEAVPVKIEILSGLVKYSVDYDFYNDIKSILEDEDEDIVIMAISALKEQAMRDKKVRDRIMKLMNKNSWKIKNEILELLLKTGVEKSEITNILPLIRDDNELVKEKALKLVGEFGDLSLISPMMSTMQEDNLGEITRGLLEKVKEKGYDNFLLGLKSEYDAIRVFTVNALTIIGDRQAVDGLIKTLNDKNWKVRYFAAEALGNIGDERALKALIKLLDDEQQYVVNSSLKAIRKIGG